MERYDIAIIGTGPAGVSAAITAKIRKKNILLLGSDTLSDKVAKAHEIHNYPGLPAIPGPDLQKALLRHLEMMEISIIKDKITLIYPMGEYFSMQGAGGMYEASSVILATGVVSGKPLPNEEEYLGRGVSYCATCDAVLYRDKTVGIVGWSPKEEAEADFMKEYAKTVYYFPQYKDEVHVADGIIVRKEKALEITAGGFKAGGLVTDKETYPLDGVFLLRDSVSPKQLVPGLEMDGPHVKVDRSLTTNVPGCFACGDIAGKPYQYIKSAGEGNVAALSAVSWLDELRRRS